MIFCWLPSEFCFEPSNLCWGNQENPVLSQHQDNNYQFSPSPPLTPDFYRPKPGVFSPNSRPVFSNKNPEHDSSPPYKEIYYHYPEANISVSDSFADFHPNIKVSTK